MKAFQYQLIIFIIKMYKQSHKLGDPSEAQLCSKPRSSNERITPDAACSKENLLSKAKSVHFESRLEEIKKKYGLRTGDSSTQPLRDISQRNIIPTPSMTPFKSTHLYEDTIQPSKTTHLYHNSNLKQSPGFSINVCPYSPKDLLKDSCAVKKEIEESIVIDCRWSRESREVPRFGWQGEQSGPQLQALTMQFQPISGHSGLQRPPESRVH